MSAIWKRYLLLGAGVLVLFAGAWFLIGRLFPSNTPGPTKSEKTADSLAITKPIDQALIDSSNARIVARGKASSVAESSAKASQASAARERRVADSLAAVAAVAVDQASAWHSAYDARNSEAIDLRKAVDSNIVVIASLKADTTELRFQLTTVNKRLKTTEDVNAGLRKDLEQARECKILGFVNCPSRIQSAALTVVTYVAVDKYRNR